MLRYFPPGCSLGPSHRIPPLSFWLKVLLWSGGAGMMSRVEELLLWAVTNYVNVCIRPGGLCLSRGMITPEMHRIAEARLAQTTLPLSTMPPRFFSAASEWRAWLEANHKTKTELLVGFYKRDSGRPSMTWSESVDEALCFGWIDGVRKSIDDVSYSIRFCVRREGSIWSKVNIAKVEALVAAGKMTPAGLASFAQRRVEKSGIYSFEQDAVEFDPKTKKVFAAVRPAWAYFQQQPAGYKKRMTWWIISARLPATKEKRLAKLIDACRRKERM